MVAIGVVVMATELVVGVVGNGVVVIAAVVMAVVVGSENSIRARSKIGGGLVYRFAHVDEVMDRSQRKN